MVMDMNFPHKHRDEIAGNDRTAGSGKSAEHKSLLARAIARQASSPSAKDFGAARVRNPDVKEAVRSSFMDERMAFFAGRMGSDLAGLRKSTLFRTGCFRPDLAQRELDKM
jgi:hypothetical protein